jgi:hypothetical protein
VDPKLTPPLLVKKSSRNGNATRRFHRETVIHLTGDQWDHIDSNDVEDAWFEPRVRRFEEGYLAGSPVADERWGRQLPLGNLPCLTFMH